MKVVFLQVKGLINVIAKFRAENLLQSFVSTKHPYEGQEILCTKTIV